MKIRKQVKIQGLWLTADFLHVYKRAGRVWYSLKNNGGAGWTSIKNGNHSNIRVHDSHTGKIVYGNTAIRDYNL
jgi:hypothetical protein